jgi:hypothetical protein
LAITYLAGTDDITAELIKTRDRAIHFKIYKLIAIWNKGASPEHWKESIIVPIYSRVIKHQRSGLGWGR